MDKATILKLEKGFWNGDERYFNKNTSEDALFVFPGMRLNKEQSIEGVKDKPRWDKLKIEQVAFELVRDNVCILSYRATSKRNESMPYNAYISSVYVIEDETPKLLLHQHTPDIE